MSCQLQGLAGLWVRLWLSWSSLSGCSWFFLLMTFTCLALKKKKNLQRGLVQWNLVFTTLEPELYSATAAKSLQSCLTLCDPIDGSPPGSAVPGILQARTLEWVAISFSNAWKWKVKVKSLSRVRLLATPRTAAHQAPPSMGFSRQEYWSGLPLPSPELYPRWVEIITKCTLFICSCIHPFIYSFFKKSIEY